jgi:hypothetical protein
VARKPAPTLTCGRLAGPWRKAGCCAPIPVQGSPSWIHGGRQPAGLCTGHRGDVPIDVDHEPDGFLRSGADPGRVSKAKWVIAEGSGLWPVYLAVRVLMTLVVVGRFVCRLRAVAHLPSYQRTRRSYCRRYAHYQAFWRLALMARWPSRRHQHVRLRSQSAVTPDQTGRARAPFGLPIQEFSS